ncbi:hypothetical protein PR048_004183 [Dryococelus australis]|uniref:HTH CENPB-type domain-containing protein n=1 Tax=Dryococelus australis TaxID=614101 RepID=A0ABQ9I5T5_9NEOP|nr:hypothetical protein PR048_004183 [Dryococelus australis]
MIASKKRQTFSLAEKLNLIKHVDSNPGRTRTAIARDLEIPVTTLNRIISNHDTIIKECSTRSTTVKKMHGGKYEEVNERLLEWFRKARSQNVPVNDLNPSNGWKDRFKKRTGIVYKTVSGEGASVDESVTDNWKMTVLPFLLQEYSAKDVFNVDECGKRSKERGTIPLGVNKDDSEKLPPLVIGKAAKPTCFKNIKSLPCRYESNQNAWMNCKIFLQYLHFLDVKMGVQNRKIILFLDHCSAHPTETNVLRNTRIEFLPPNTTACLQPMDQGIIKNFKHHFRSRLYKTFLRDLEATKALKKISLLTAMYMTAASWTSMPQSVIANCFRKTGFTHASVSFTTTGDEVEMLVPSDEWGTLQTKLEFSSTVDEHISVNDDTLPSHRRRKEAAKFLCGYREEGEGWVLASYCLGVVSTCVYKLL